MTQIQCSNHNTDWTSGTWSFSKNGASYEFTTSCLRTRSAKEWGGNLRNPKNGNIVASVSHKQIKEQICSGIQEASKESINF